VRLNYAGRTYLCAITKRWRAHPRIVGTLLKPSKALEGHSLLGAWHYQPPACIVPLTHLTTWITTSEESSTLYSSPQMRLDMPLSNSESRAALRKSKLSSSPPGAAPATLQTTQLWHRQLACAFVVHSCAERRELTYGSDLWFTKEVRKAHPSSALSKASARATSSDIESAPSLGRLRFEAAPNVSWKGWADSKLCRTCDCSQHPTRITHQTTSNPLANLIKAGIGNHERGG
jgi:hypothetical protein